MLDRVGRIRERILALGVRRLALFGSVARDAGRVGGDVDMLVEFAPGEKTFERLLAVVTTEGLGPHIGPHIMAEASDVVSAA